MRFAIPALTELLGFSVPVLAADRTGTRLTDGGMSHVRIERCGECIAWQVTEARNENGDDKLDIHNRAAALRRRTILGIELLTGFPLGAGDVRVWRGGEIYNTENGKTCRSTLELAGPGTFEASGCVFIFCETWISERVR